MTDDEVRDFLERNPEVLRTFLAKELRIGAQWLQQFLRREDRTGRRMDIR
jgi:hypothetical protein